VFIGHFGVGMAAKKPARRPSLGTLFLAAEWPDLIWPIFLILHIEHVYIEPGLMAMCPLDFADYPLSHSLLADVGWACLLAGIYYLFRKDSRGARWVWFCVVSHWILDAIVHRPDLPLYPGSRTLVGLGLWNSVAGTLIVEGGIFVAGLWLYVKATRPRGRRGVFALWSFILVLVAIYLANIFGPPPPNLKSLEIAGLALWLIPAWGYWIDRHREMRPPEPSGVPPAA
jgi:membrane-bound metal-dependent hydrolase YbcI (DUF457 family)